MSRAASIGLALGLLCSWGRAFSQEASVFPAALEPGSKPLSAQLIHTRLQGIGLEYTQGGAVVEDLSLAVRGSRRAEELVLKGEQEAATGRVLMITGLAIGIPCGVIALWMALDASSNPLVLLGLAPSQIGVIYALLAVTLVCLGVEYAGIAMMNSGRTHAQEGINAFNADLLDGRLVSPAARALPQT